MELKVLILLGVLLAAILYSLEVFWNSWRSGRASCYVMPRPYRDRGSSEHLWRQRCGDEAMEQASTVLTLVCNAFMFNPDGRYQLKPDDRIADIYRRCYPRWCLRGDAAEIESLMADLEKEFGFEESKWQQDITIGEIVIGVIRASGQKTGNTVDFAE